MWTQNVKSRLQSSKCQWLQNNNTSIDFVNKVPL